MAWYTLIAALWMVSFIAVYSLIGMWRVVVVTERWLGIETLI
jgi:hypothetical protein